MRYKNAKVISHPRAGSHYFSKLLNDNFFHRSNYLDLYAGHGSGHKIHLKSSSTAVFYIYRNNQDTLKSIYTLRDRFGLKVDSYEEFLTSKLTDMNNYNIVSEAVYNSGDSKKIVTDVDHFIGSFPTTPEGYLNLHKEFWQGIQRSNFFIISYDDLIADFEHTMGLVAWFLESDINTFTKENRRIGWYDKNESEKIFA